MKLRERALALLANREHSRLELKRKLLAKDYALDEVDVLLAALIEDGLQSDERYTEAYVRVRVSVGFGPLRINMELQRRGVSDSLINRYLHQNEAFWWDVLRGVWERKYSERPAEHPKEYARQARFLIQRGFDSAQVYKLLAM